MPPGAGASRASAAAFAPGHVTGLFAPAAQGRDPRARGSVGAGVVLELGVTAVASWRPGGRPRVALRADVSRDLPISRDAAVRLVGGRRGRLEVRLRHDLPIGQGFGMSAAGAFATSLAVARVLGLPRRRAIEVAHLADLFGGGGLGGVAAILGGGLEVRRRPGIPPRGTVLHRAFPRALLVGVVGAPLPSPRLLSDPRFLARVSGSAEGALRRLARRPDAASFLRESERFTDAVGLAPRGLATLLSGLRRDGARAAQAMFGRSFFAVPRDSAARRKALHRLARAGVPVVELRAAARGARLLPGPGGERLLPRTRLARTP